jgi:hypothetical protein
MKKAQAKAPPLRKRRSPLVAGAVPPRPPPPPETGWVILAPHDLTFWTGHTRHSFERSAVNALRFSRQIDAVLVRDHLLGDPLLLVREHTWPAAA